MDDPTAIDGQVLRGVLDTLVMNVLRRGPNYGFGIQGALEGELGTDASVLKEETLYPLLHRLESRGFLASHQEPGDRGRPRKYYRLTKTGAAFLERRVSEWMFVVSLLERTVLSSPARNVPSPPTP